MYYWFIILRAYNNRMYRENPLFLSVRIGSTFYEGTGEKIDVVAVYFYPTYNPRKLHNNLAILRLTRLINFHNKRIKKIEIDREAHPLPVLSSGILVLGWGSRMVSFTVTNTCARSFVSRFSTMSLFCNVTKGSCSVPTTRSESFATFGTKWLRPLHCSVWRNVVRDDWSADLHQHVFYTYWDSSVQRKRTQLRTPLRSTVQFDNRLSSALSRLATSRW